MSRPKKLAYGQTPFDTMPEAELRRFAKRALWAVHSAACVLGMAKALEPNSPYWTQGSGGGALAVCEATIRAGLGTASPDLPESLWRNYYRPALHALFADALYPDGAPVFDPLYTCDICGMWSTWVGEGRGEPTCLDGHPMRLMTLDDVEQYQAKGNKS